jgi:hypothetical protein
MMNHKHKKSTSLILLLCGALLSALLVWGLAMPTTVQAQGPTPLTITVKAGFDGKYKDGQWVPVHVVLENNGPDLEGLIRFEFGSGSAAGNITEYSIDLPSTSKKEVVVYLYPQGYDRTLQVSFTSDKKTLAKAQLQLDNFASTDLWYGILAVSPTTFNILSQISTPNNTARTIPLDIQDIPERAHILGSLDVLIFSNIDSGKLTHAQRQALKEWVAGGGKLILTGGVDWQKTGAGFLDTDLLPLIPSGTTEVKNLANLSLFADSSDELPGPEQGLLAATGSLAADAQVLVEADQGSPLILQKPYGAGEVLYLTFDPGLAVFRNWGGREDFFRSLLSTRSDKPSWSAGIRNWIQAKESALTLPNLNLPSPLLICGFLGIYILALGPFNYFLVRFLKRSELGWVTIPVMVLSFTVLILLVGTLSRGSRVVLNRMALVQVWPGVPQARVDGVMGIYSPTRSTYQAEVDAPTLLHPLPSDYGGTTKSYVIQETGDKTMIPGIKLEVSGIEPFAFESSIPSPVFTDTLTIELSETSAQLNGSLTNASNLSLQEAVLLYPGGYQNIGDFVPGQRIDVQQPLMKAQLAGESDINPTITSYQNLYYAYVPPYSSPIDSTISDILGTGNYYDDRKVYRKYAFLTAITNNYYGTGSSRGSGIYLVGWTDQLPVEVNLTDTPTKKQDNILYIIQLNPTFKTEQTASSGKDLTLTPGTFKWSLIEGNDPSLSPYNANLYPGVAFSFQFSPIQSVKFSKAKSLIFHLEGNPNGYQLNAINVSLWDFTENTWQELEDLHWGENDLGNPGRYIDENGTIRLNISSGQTGGVTITRADFTVGLEK